jgi:hypothetical protein
MGKRTGGLGGGLIVFIVGRDDGLQVFGFKNLVAIEATYIVHTVTTCQDFGTGVIAGLHKNEKEIIPILSM